MRRLEGGHELLDGRLDEQLLAGNLRDLARINRWLGGADLSERAVAPLALNSFALSILDVGTGGADIPLRLARDGREITATDIRPEIVAAAMRVEGRGRIVVREGALPDESSASFDVVHASLVIHHLEPSAAVTFLSHMRRVCRQAVVINDLDRGWRWWAGAWLLTRIATRNQYTRHDAPLSVRRAYTEKELVRMAQQAGLRPVARYGTRPGYRYALVFVPEQQAGG
ncbi:MAG TPA: methyltransferase domain-containing protein [Candidatus Limnocylindrales bacterium]